MSEQISLRFLVSRVYGKMRYYPACKLSETMLKLMGERKAFREEDLEIIRGMDFDIVIERK